MTDVYTVSQLNETQQQWVSQLDATQFNRPIAYYSGVWAIYPIIKEGVKMGGSSDPANYTGFCVRWTAKVHRGALAAKPLKRLLECMNSYLAQTTPNQPVTLAWIISSAGADVSDPFQSLLAIEGWMQALERWKQEYNLTLMGWVKQPGVYGGASLVLNSAMDILLVEEPNAMQLTGRVSS